jgi:hypothetical protein
VIEMPNEEVGQDTYHLVLKGNGVMIDRMVDAQVAGAIARLAFGGVATEAIQAPDPRSAVPVAADRLAERSGVSVIPGQRLSLREYLQRSAVDRGIHGKILAVGRYMRDHESQSDFSREDIRSRFRTAGEPQPANFHRDFQKAVREGWVAEDHQNRGRFYVTRTGDEEIDRRQDVPAVTIRNPPARRRTRRRLANDGPQQ